MAGRPSDYDFELCKLICDEVASGRNIVDVLDSDERFPTWNTFRRWKNDIPELSALYVRAQQDKSEMCLYKIDKLQSKLENGNLEPSSANVLIQTEKWKAGKFYPKMYGTKNDVHDTDEDEKANTKKINVTVNVKNYQKKDGA